MQPDLQAHIIVQKKKPKKNTDSRFIHISGWDEINRLHTMTELPETDRIIDLSKLNHLKAFVLEFLVPFTAGLLYVT